MRDVVVVFVHGINVTCQDYYVAMRDRLIESLPRKDREYLTFRAVFWADIVRGHQQEYMLYAKEKLPNFSESKLRKLVIEGFGDAAAYQKTEWTGTAYYRVQERIKTTLRNVSTGPDDKRPLVFVGHSLGCHIISSYAWDLHRLKPRCPEFKKFTKNNFWQDEPGSPLERLDTFAGFVTMGSNMPLFTFTFGPQHVFPITQTKPKYLKDHHPPFPGPNLEDAVRDAAYWLNFFSANDPLGYPLKPLNEAYDTERRLFDVPVKSEGAHYSLLARGFLRELLAARAHGGYWTNNKVVDRTAAMLHRLITAGDPEPKKFWNR